MQKLLGSFIVIFLLMACSEESKVKTKALDGAAAQFQREMREEIEKSVVGKTNLTGTAVKVLTDRSEFSVDQTEVAGDSAIAVVEVKTVPAKARIALIEIMGRLDPQKTGTFNVSNALNLIGQQLQLGDTREVLLYKLELEKKDQWRLKAP